MGIAGRGVAEALNLLLGTAPEVVEILVAEGSCSVKKHGEGGHNPAEVVKEKKLLNQEEFEEGGGKARRRGFNSNSS